MRRMDYISGSVLLAFAALLFWQTGELVVWGPFGPSSGFFPLGLSILLAILSLVIIIRAGRQSEKISGRVNILGPDKRKYFFYLACFFAFSLIFAKAGYTLTLVGFLGFILKVVEKQSWKMTLGIILTAAAFSHFLFVKFLSVPLPEGPLSFLLKSM